MRILICGLGSIGRRHLRNLVDLGEEDIVLLRTGMSTLPDEELAGFPVESDLPTALERWSPQAVIVANPTSMHVETALQVAESGCALLIEKPVSHALDGIDQLELMAREDRASILVGYQFRFHPGLRWLREHVIGGSIGEPLSASAQWGEYLPAWHPWEDYRDSYSARQDLGGGVTLTLSHPFDYLRWILGEVEAVTALVTNQGELGLAVATQADVLLQFEAGAVANVHIDYNQRPKSHWLEVVGTKGTIFWDDMSSTARVWRVDKAGWQAFEPQADFERNTMFADEIKHFVQELAASNGEPACTLHDGVQALEIALAAERSSQEGRTVAMGQLRKELIK